LKIDYKIKTATEAEICTHLIECSASFRPPLDVKVNIPEYATKIFNNSITFEAWNGNSLIGLVAAYFNDIKKHSGYITNVSVVAKYKGQGIASSLLNNCIDYAIKNNFKEVDLEVSEESKNAIHMYKNFGFYRSKSKGEYSYMKLVLSEKE
jgi:ribosomal protein S18 acetylase RimI-like enzyme